MLVSVCMAVSASGCAITSSYKVSDNEDSSRLRIKIDSPGSMSQVFISMLDAKDCSSTGLWANIIGGPERSFEENRVGMLGGQPPTKGVLEYKVAANKQYVVVAPIAAMRTTVEDIIGPLLLSRQDVIKQSESRRPLSCKAPAFMAEPNGQYEIVYYFRPQEECAINIYELSAGSGSGIIKKDITHSLKIYADRDGQFSKYKCEK